MLNILNNLQNFHPLRIIHIIIYSNLINVSAMILVLISHVNLNAFELQRLVDSDMVIWLLFLGLIFNVFRILLIILIILFIWRILLLLIFLIPILLIFLENTLIWKPSAQISFYLTRALHDQAQNYDHAYHKISNILLKIFFAILIHFVLWRFWILIIL